MMTTHVRQPVRDGGAAAAQELLLWQRWREQRDAGARERLIALHQPLARTIAARVYKGRYTDSVEFGDYLQFATVGLIEAIERYAPGGAASFATFASPRINGAVLDGVVMMSEQHQQVGLKQRLARQRSASLASERKRPAAIGDVFADLAQIAVGLAVGFMLDGSTMVEAGERPCDAQHYSSLELAQLQRQMRSLIETLPCKEAMIIKYHYLQQLPFETAADIMGLSKGRVSQLHKRALVLLREGMQRIRPCDLAW